MVAKATNEPRINGVANLSRVHRSADPYLVSLSRPLQDDSVHEGAIRSRGLLIFAIGSIAFGNAVMVSVMSMAPVHLVHSGTTLAIVGLTISLHIAGMYALSPLFGLLSDRLERVTTIPIGQGVFVIALVMVALGVRNTVLIGIGLVFLGLGWSASTVSESALVADLATGADGQRIQGRADLMRNLGGAIGGAAAGLVLVMVGYAGLALSAGILVLAVVVAAGIFGSGSRGNSHPAIRAKLH